MGEVGALRQEVFHRDEWRCLAPLLDPTVTAYDCMGPFQIPALLAPGVYRVDSLTLEHVHEEPGMRRVHRKDHCITLCWYHNVEGWSQSHRTEENEHLDNLYGRERRLAT